MEQGTASVAAADATIDGHPVYTLSCGHAECEMTVLAAQLADYPSLAGQSIYLALQLRTTDSKDVKLQLEIDDGRGGGTARTSNATLVAGAGWQTHRTFAMLAWGGEATFGVRVFGASCENDSCQSSVQVAAVAIAPIGQAWAL